MKERRQVLLIEDDPQMRHFVCRSLAADFDVRAVASGLSGLVQAQAQPPDLVLLDVQMPDLDGIQVCERLRRDSITANIPIIMLTVLDQLDAKIRGLRAGADDYITKPFQIEELRTRIYAHLRRSERDLSASPLTHLPGNPLIEQTLSVRLMSQSPAAFLYIDLTHFKEYNDRYGWLKGDRVIRGLGRYILGAVAERGNAEDFVGHIGGDDFVVITTPPCAAPIAQEIIDRFDAALPTYYDRGDYARGYIEATNRQGKAARVPLLSVAIAIITNAKRKLRHPGQVAVLAAEVKRHVKQFPGSHYAFDRRSK